MASQRLLSRRIENIEQNVEELKLQLKPRGKWAKFSRYMLSNWGFWGFWLTLIVALLVYWHYDLSYFETQKNAARMKTSANTYVKLGDRLILMGEMRAAADAYRTALDIDKSNVEASRGLLKTTAFKPVEGQKYVTPEVTDRTIDFLSSIQTDASEGYLISYYRGERFEAQKKYAEAKVEYQKSTEQNPDFIFGYVALAYVAILKGDGIDAGMTELIKARDRLDRQHAPKSALVLNNLGFCYLAKRKYEAARDMLKEACEISPFLEAYVNLGNAYRQITEDGNLDQALANHELALEELREEDEESPYGDLAINFLPETVDDINSPRCYAVFSTIDEKRSLVYYELSLDYALQNNWHKADYSFERAFQLDRDRAYPDFIYNKIVSLQDSLGSKVDKRILRWFAKQKARLAPDLSVEAKDWSKPKCLGSKGTTS